MTPLSPVALTAIAREALGLPAGPVLAPGPAVQGAGVRGLLRLDAAAEGDLLLARRRAAEATAPVPMTPVGPPRRR